MEDRFTKHHIYFPRRNYRTRLQKEFRSLPCNIVWMRESDHHKLHLCMAAPTMPTNAQMEEEIADFKNGRCGCSHHKRSTYGLLPPLASAR